MFSLDENFASERVPRAHLAIKGKYDDMECMCREASVILGIIKELQEHSRSGKHVLKYALSLAGYNLGSSFYSGRGVAQDNAETARLWRLAAAQGHSDAQYNDGYMLENGEGVPPDQAEAVRLCRLAADQGDQGAQ